MTRMESLPGWGEWVEIGRLPLWVRTYAASLPGWGEWVEIWMDISVAIFVLVSPRMGRVG